MLFKLVDCQNYLVKLERKVEDCNDPARIRLLDKGEENLADLMKKLEEVRKAVSFDECSKRNDLNKWFVPKARDQVVQSRGAVFGEGAHS